MAKKKIIQHSESNQEQGQSDQGESSSHFEAQANNENNSNSQSAAKPGRPSKTKQITKQKFDIKLVSPTSEVTTKITDKFMQFFHSIGKKNGLTISQAIRKKINKERKQAKKALLNQKNKRKYETEKIKLQAALSQFQILKKLKNQFSKNPQMLKKIGQFKETIFSLIYESCGITPQDFTEQMYSYFVEILNNLYKFIGQNQKIENAIKEFGSSIKKQNSRYQYLSFNFWKNSQVKQMKLQDSDSINKRYCQVTVDIGKLLHQYLQQNSQKMFYKNDN